MQQVSFSFIAIRQLCMCICDESEFPIWLIAFLCDNRQGEMKQNMRKSRLKREKQLHNFHAEVYINNDKEKNVVLMFNQQKV